MKKLIFMVALVLLVFAGCSNEEEKTTTENQKVISDKTGEEKEVDTSDKRSKEEIEKEGELVEVGQTAEDPSGKVELMKMKDINETIKQGPLKIELINAKIIKRTDMSQEFLNYINQFSQVKKGDELSYLQLRYIVENTSNQDVSWAGLSNIVTDKKEQIDVFAEGILLLNTGSELLGNVIKEYTQGFIIDKPNLSNVRLIFDSAKKIGSYETLSKNVEYEFSFD